MKVWLPIFFAVFIVAEALQWAQGLTLPTPFFVVAGVILAAVSNHDRQAGIPFKWFRQWQDLQEQNFKSQNLQGQDLPQQEFSPLDFQAIAQPLAPPANDTAPVQFQELHPRNRPQGTPLETATEAEKVL